MIRNFLKIALRNLSKNKAFSAINIFGLAIGIAAWKTPGVRAVEDHLMLVQPTAFAALMS